MVSEVAPAVGGPRVPQQARARATRRVLLAAAGEHFAVHGFHGTPLSELLEHGPATKGAFYFHFASKQALAEALVAAMTQSWDQVLPAVRGAAGDALEALVLLTDAVIVRLDDPIVRGAGRVLRDRVVASPTLAEVSGWWRDQAEGLLLEARDAGLLRTEADPAWVAGEVVAGLAGRATVHDSPGSGEPLWDLMNTFWAGLLPLIAAPGWVEQWAARPWQQRARPVGVGPHDVDRLEIHAIGALPDADAADRAAPGRRR
ncbi:TetR/AcrR family transcriptional regulator [Actinomycetospora cinnamomea]|uniref:TetR family transcriptional regulator n=1 Tax=Actinomycetospora cinnamomea TaxID=663609 RepID=A0A2U1EDB5_9PSEU|nr:TetR/AcrR family transcriptional regulator [Actinomycetospora cinnamomea]PVY97956.1 TetR family transcriptional regulator [Actinomycetospora cinnamomea]